MTTHTDTIDTLRRASSEMRHHAGGSGFRIAVADWFTDAWIGLDCGSYSPQSPNVERALNVAREYLKEWES